MAILEIDLSDKDFVTILEDVPAVYEEIRCDWPAGSGKNGGHSTT
jgi:hypothetical protein